MSVRGHGSRSCPIRGPLRLPEHRRTSRSARRAWSGRRRIEHERDAAAAVTLHDRLAHRPQRGHPRRAAAQPAALRRAVSPRPSRPKPEPLRRRRRCGRASTSRAEHVHRDRRMVIGRHGNGRRPSRGSDIRLTKCVLDVRTSRTDTCCVPFDFTRRGIRIDGRRERRQIDAVESFDDVLEFLRNRFGCLQRPELDLDVRARARGAGASQSFGRGPCRACVTNNVRWCGALHPRRARRTADDCRGPNGLASRCRCRSNTRPSL